LEEIATINNYWSRKLESIPVADPESAFYSDAAGADKLKDYGALALIDSLVLKYPAYTHDDIFNLSLGLVYELLCINKQRDAVSAGAARMRRKNIK